MTTTQQASVPAAPDGSSAPPVRVLVADDHTMLRDGLRLSMLDAGFEVVAEAANGTDAVRLAVEHQPDVVLMDVSMPILDGIEATRLIRQRHPEVQVVMLTMHSESEVVSRALDAGAAGYLVKDCSTDEVVAAVRMAAGEVALSPQVAISMLAEVQRIEEDETSPEPVLSHRESEVLQLVADGLAIPEVAAAMYISVKTVKNHLASVYQKLDARDRTQAVLRAVRMGIIRLD